MEIVFTWRTSKPISDPSRDYLEVHLGSTSFLIKEPGIADDFMRQFFHPSKPVSFAAKLGFIKFFPRLLNEGPIASKAVLSREIDSTTSIAPNSVAPSTVNKSKTASQMQQQKQQQEKRRWREYLREHLLRRALASCTAPTLHDRLAQAFILLYCALLILLSLPPALLRRKRDALVRRGRVLVSSCSPGARATHAPAAANSV